MNKQCYICGKPMTLVYKDREFRGKTLKNIGAYECECGEIVYTSEQVKYIERQLIGAKKRSKAMDKCKCPKCKKDDMVCPSTIFDYVCLRCCCMFDSKEKKHDSKTANQ